METPASYDRVLFKRYYAPPDCIVRTQPVNYSMHAIGGEGAVSACSIRFGRDMYVLKNIEKYIYILALEMASPGNQHCVPIVSAYFRSRYTLAEGLQVRVA